MLIQFPNIIGRCRGCGTKAYTVKELNLHEDQKMICYYCLEEQRGLLKLISK